MQVSLQEGPFATLVTDRPQGWASGGRVTAKTPVARATQVVGRDVPVVNVSPPNGLQDHTRPQTFLSRVSGVRSMGSERCGVGVGVRPAEWEGLPRLQAGLPQSKVSGVDLSFTPRRVQGRYPYTDRETTCHPYVSKSSIKCL